MVLVDMAVAAEGSGVADGSVRNPERRCDGPPSRDAVRRRECVRFVAARTRHPGRAPLPGSSFRGRRWPALWPAGDKCCFLFVLAADPLETHDLSGHKGGLRAPRTSHAVCFPNRTETTPRDHRSVCDLRHLPERHRAAGLGDGLITPSARHAARVGELLRAAYVTQACLRDEPSALSCSERLISHGGNSCRPSPLRRLG